MNTSSVGRAARSATFDDERARWSGADAARPLVRLVLIVNVAALPILVPRGPSNSVPADLPAIALIVLGAAMLWRSRRPLRLPLGLTYTLIVVGGLLGTAQSMFPRSALASLLIDVYIFVWFLVLVNCMTQLGRSGVGAVASAWVWTAAIIGVVGFIALVLGHERVPTLLGYDFVDRWDRFSGTFRDPNMAGGYLVLSLFVLAASPWPRRWLVKLLLSLPMLVAIQATRSNTALFALVAGVAVAITVSVIRSRRTALGLAFGISACALVVFAVAPSSIIGAPASVARSLGDTETFSGSLGRFDSSLGARLDRMGQALQLFGPQVIVGIGPSTTKQTLLARGASIGGEMHNDYVAALLERGIVGIIGVVGLMATALWTSVALGRRSVAREGWATSALAGGVAAVIVIAMGLEALHFRHIWMFFALVFALSLLEQQGGGRGIDPTEAAASGRSSRLGG